MSKMQSTMSKTQSIKKGGVYRIRNLESLDAFDFNPDIHHDNFLFNNKQRMDYEWMQRQFDYLNGLSDRQRDIINIYTKYGDKFVNSLLRGTPMNYMRLLNTAMNNSDNPFIHQHKDATNETVINARYRDNITEYIQQFIKELQDIILAAPRLTRPITVFKGIREDSFLKGGHFVEKGFSSTSFRLDSALMFSRGECCILEINLQPSVPCIVAGHFSRRRGEYEITLIPNVIFEQGESQMKYVITDMDYDTKDIFSSPDEFDLSRIMTHEIRAFIA